VHPVSVGALNEAEVDAFIQSLARLPGLGYIAELSQSERQRIGAACHGLPLAIRWTLGRSASAAETLARADAIKAADRSDDELLEFSFRRVFESMTSVERSVVEAISLFQRPLPAEAVIVGTGLASVRVGDALDDLVADAIVQRLFDSDRNDYCFSLHPITRAFARGRVSSQMGRDEKIRKQLADWFEAKDVFDSSERLAVREIRQGKSGNELALYELGQAAERRGDHDSAEKLYMQALTRNPRSWKVARALGEFNRHTKQHRMEALRFYEQAAAHAPRRGQDRALIFREWGILLRDSGEADSTDRAIEKLEVALVEIPNDPITLHSLAHMLSRKGSYTRVIKLMEPLAGSSHRKTRDLAQELLTKAYEMTGDILKAAQLKQERDGNRL
jgi:tetratricopeptide (TPR) repeat protein